MHGNSAVEEVVSGAEGVQTALSIGSIQLICPRTALRVRVDRPDCEPFQAVGIRLREGNGAWIEIYNGHPGGFFSTGDKYKVTVDEPPQNRRRLEEEMPRA